MISREPSREEARDIGRSGRARILEGVRVLDLTRFLSGPQATLFLAAMGAEVIRIDDPVTGDPTANAPPFFGPEGVSLDRKSRHDLGIAYLKRSRGKKAITLNLKSEQGRGLFLQLIRVADVLVENFRPGVTERLGIDFPKLSAVNPRLIHCAITGFGSTGRDRRLKAYDLMVQAATGFMSITGDVGGEPCKTGSPLSDGIAGTFAMSGILGALFQRERIGCGQFIDVSMSDCLISLMLDEPLDCYSDLGLPQRQGNRIMRFSPFNTYPTHDGRVAIGVATQDDLIALCDVMGRRDLLERNDFTSASWRIANNKEVDEIVASWTRRRTNAELIAELTACDVPCSPIRRIHDVVVWPHLRDRGMLERLVHPGLPDLPGPLAPAFPLKFSESPTDFQRPAPMAGEHNNDVYEGILGLSAAQMQELSGKGVI